MDANIARAKKIVERVPYITIATFSRHRKPWATPVFSAFDEQYKFYWVSEKTAWHSENIRSNNEVAIVVFDSSVSEGEGVGVYMEALVYELEEDAEIANAIKLLSLRANQSPRDVYDFVDNSPRRIYKAVPQKVWVSSAEKNSNARIEINLLEK